MAHDVFISYSSKDKAVADATLAVLEQNGIRCWIAPRDITPGMNWGGAIIEAINHARIMVLVFSGHANKSQQIEREIERAVNRSITIIPLRIANVTPEKSLEYFISTPHWLDAFTPPLEKHLQTLADTVRSILASQSEVRTPPEFGMDTEAAQQDRSHQRSMGGEAQQGWGRSESSPDEAARNPVDAAELNRAAWSVRFLLGLMAVVVLVVAAAGSAAIFFKPRPSPPSAEAVFLFDKDQVVLPQSAGTTIDREVAFLRDNPKVTVTIRAFCSDDEGWRVGPKTLAALRANAVRNALKARGIPGGRVAAENGCQTRAASAAGDAAAEAQDRRAVLIRN